MDHPDIAIKADHHGRIIAAQGITREGIQYLQQHPTRKQPARETASKIIDYGLTPILY